MDLVQLIFHNFFAFLIVLSVIVFVHEFGHYLVAKKCGVKIKAFSIGFGKELFGWKDKSGTKWKVCILPLGGYVKMFGDVDVTSFKQDKKKLEKLTPEKKKQTFYFQSVYKRIAVVSAGPLFNFLLALVVLTVFFRIQGIIEFEPIVDEVIEGSVAEKYDIRSGDIIQAINDEEITTFEEIQIATHLNQNKTMEIRLLRNGNVIVKNLKPESLETKDRSGADVKTGMIGITASSVKTQRVNILESFFHSAKTIYGICANTLIALGQMIVGNRSVRELGGVVRIAKYSGQYMKDGLFAMVWFISIISANLGLMNLLPIPMLDGGHLLLYLIEAVRKKPLSERIQERLFKVGFVFLIAIMAFSTVNDIINIW